jgi:transcriptional regulator with XRE-family HTH domain
VPASPETAARRRRQLGDAIKATRKAAGFTQEKTALLAGLDRSFYVEVETGKRSLTVDRLMAVADALEVSAADLLAGIR